MDSLIFLGIVVIFALPVLAILAIFGAAVVRLGWHMGLARGRWSFRLLAVLGMMTPAAIWQHLDRLRAAQCLAVNGPYDLSCKGELGGVFLTLLQSGLILGGLIVGFWLGGYLHRRWASRAP